MSKKGAKRRNALEGVVEDDHLAGEKLNAQTNKEPSPRQKRLQEKRKKESIKELKAEIKYAKEKEKISKRLPNRATYDLNRGIKEMVVLIAEKHGTTASQVANFLLEYALDEMPDITPFLVPSDSPRYKNNIKK